MTSVSFIVEIEPRGWARPRKNGKRFFKDEATANFQRTIGVFALAAMRGREPFAGPVMVSVASVMSVPASWSRKKRNEAICGNIVPTSKPDIDNLFKGVADALNGIAYRDDAQIVTGTSTKRYGLTPEVRVTVAAINQDNTQGESRLRWPAAASSELAFQEERSS